MKSPRFCVLVILPWIVVRSFTFAQTSTPSDVADNARQQAADKTFADAERALTVRLLDKATAQADADAALLDEVKASSKSLSDRILSLRTSDEGKRLAHALDVISAQEVQRLIDDPPVLPEVLAAQDKEVESVNAQLKKLRDDPPPGYVPPDAQQDELLQLSASLRQTLAHVKERDGWITSLASSAPKDINLAASPTLDAALADFRLRQQQDWNAAQKAGIEQAKPEALAQITESARTAELEKSLAQAHAMLQEVRSQIELSNLDHEMQLRLVREEKDSELAALNKKIAESEAKRDVVNAQSDATIQRGKEDAEAVRLRQKCQDPEVKKLLAPFIAVGLWQPGDHPGQPWIHDRGPVSLSALKKTGSLQPTQRGLTQLYIEGNATYINWPYQVHPDKERPKWGYPRDTRLLSQDDWQQLRHAQDLLNELGETMVELKMLSE